MLGQNFALCLLVSRRKSRSWGLGPAPYGAARLPPTTQSRRSQVANRLFTVFFTVVGCVVLPHVAWASSDSDSRQIPQLRPPVAARGEIIEGVWLVPDVGAPEPLQLQAARPGQPVSAGQVRAAMRELLSSGRVADVRTEFETLADGRVRLLLFASWRKIVAKIDVRGGELEEAQVADALGLRLNQELTHKGLDEAAARVRLLYLERGFPHATVSGVFHDTRDPLRAEVTITVAPGEPAVVSAVHVQLPQQVLPEVHALASAFGVSPGERVDHVELDKKRRALLERFVQAGFLRANVEYHVTPALGVIVEVTPRELISVRYEGMRAFDAPTLRAEVEVDEDERTTTQLRGRLLSFYERHGFYDARVRVAEVRSADGLREEWVFSVQEGKRLQIVTRLFPCLEGPLSLFQVNDELDGVLGEQLPGGDTVLAPVDPGILDKALEDSPNPNAVEVRLSDPWSVYSPGEYERALTHLGDLYRAEGYLSATVGPATLLRRQCEPGTQGKSCRPIGQRTVPPARCPTVAEPLPQVDEVTEATTCRPEPTRGIFCEPVAALSIPVKLGPRTTLWDVEFQGNQLLIDDELFAAAELPLGKPLSQVELQKARRRIRELYGDRGFAFAQVDVELDLSQDRTRGKARFVISEREPVTIRSFVVRGAEQTLESVVLGRLALRKGGLYRRDLVRSSEEQLSTLGVFSSVTIELEDPDVPAREKVVVITVEERPSQYVDVKPGFSSGEGARLALEYGHRNLFGRALQLRFRVQVGYLPNELILDREVRQRFEALTFSERLERRNSVTVEVPFAQRFRLAVEGVDVRDNTRDFGLTKRAAIVTVSHRPSRSVSWVTGTSVEDNDVTILNDRETLKEYLENNPQYVRLLNVPEGRSYALAFRLGGVWDRTDNPFGATRGTFFSLESEPVVAFLDSDSTVASDLNCEEQTDAQCKFVSRFIKLTSRIAGYIPFNDKGLSLALSLRVGAIFQLAARSITYPDRWFFLGGSDSLRGHLQDSVIPEDLTPQISADGSDGMMTARRIVTRGGDMIINPRVELRIPLTKLLQTALFLDTGNVWRDINNVEPWVLRYSAGTGLRIATPVGPLAFDYGFRLDRRFYESDIGAFHFSVGLF